MTLIAHYYLAKHLPLMSNENEICMQWHEILFLQMKIELQ